MSLKRSIDISETQTKKLKNISSFESLSNELFYEIFEYLDGCDLITAFSRLNQRFENLLQYSSLSLPIKFTSISESKLEQNCRNIVLPYKHRIHSLHLCDCDLKRSFFSNCIIDDSFTRLESIILIHISSPDATTALFFFKSLPRLTSLTIQLEDDYYTDPSSFFHFIFHLPSLKFLSITADSSESDIEIPMAINSKPSPIERMILNINLSISEFIAVIQHTPNLKYFTCERLVDMSDIIPHNESLLLTQLTYLKIKKCETSFNEFEKLMKTISSKLRIFHMKTSSFQSFLNANRWEQLIKKHMPVLHEFYLDGTTENDEYYPDDIKPDPKMLKEFTSSFWTDRNWYFEFIDASDRYEYSIHPADPNKSNTQLKIIEYDGDSWYDGYIDNAKRIYEAIEFTHLSIDCTDLLPNLMIRIFHLLPKLTSLKVISLSPIDVNDLCLSFDESEMLFLISINSRIRKMKIRETKSIDFLMKFCPRIEHLEIEYTSDIDFSNILGCIAINNPTFNRCLRCLSVTNLLNTQQTIHDLQNYIDFEQLLAFNSIPFNSYVIEEKNKELFLTWK